ncbi:hypothetical protein P3L10_024425 [Capsicum annuum]
MFQVVQKLKKLKYELKKMGNQHTRSIVDEDGDDRKALKLAQAYLQQYPLNQGKQQKEKEAYCKYKQSSYLAEMKLKQAITQVKNNHREWQHDSNSIAKVFVDYYKALLGSKETGRVKAKTWFLKNGPMLTMEQQIQLIIPLSHKDIKAAMFSININKSSGPDGFGAGFFKLTWSIVGSDISDAILEFFEYGKLLTQINSTNIALIPK